jgi:hypothetical protein
MITRTLGEVKDLRTDIGRLERDLESTGTLKTVEDVQHEVDQISNDMCVAQCPLSESGQDDRALTRQQGTAARPSYFIWRQGAQGQHTEE